ncbi:hypothetical protein HY640_04670 [Candidatus Woesearchaeota archaeon]|nr:hypothetical protein [Candidatus Woesearchaeota archaeon]
MESVEVWMWVIAGVMIAGLILVGSYQFLSKYFYNADFESSRSELDRLVLSLNHVCSSGLGSKESLRLKLSDKVSRVFVRNSEGVEGSGRFVCMGFGSEGYCSEVRVCEASMRGIELEQKSSVLDFVYRTFGSRKSADFDFAIKKSELRKLSLEWQRAYSAS